MGGWFLLSSLVLLHFYFFWPLFVCGWGTLGNGGGSSEFREKFQCYVANVIDCIPESTQLVCPWPNVVSYICEDSVGSSQSHPALPLSPGSSYYIPEQVKFLLAGHTWLPFTSGFQLSTHQDIPLMVTLPHKVLTGPKVFFKQTFNFSIALDLRKTF